MGKIWKYIQINSLKQARKDERVCAYYPNSAKNTDGYKTDDNMIAAEKDAKAEKCKLLVWREVDDEIEEEKRYTLTERDVEQIITRYNNAKAETNRLQSEGKLECRFECGRALALEGVLRMLGFDYEEVGRKYWIGEESDGCKQNRYE